MRTQPKVSEAPRALPTAGRRERDLILPWGYWAAVMWKRASVASWGRQRLCSELWWPWGWDPRLCCLKATCLRDGEARGGSRAAPWLSGKLHTVCSASHVHCWSQFPSAGARMGMGYCSGTVAEDAGPGQRRLLWVSAAGLRNLGSQGVSLLPLRSKTPPCPWKDASMSVCSLCFIKKVHRNNRGSSLLKTSEVRLSLHWLVLGSQCFNKAFGSLCLPSAIPVKSLWGVAGFDMHWCTRGALLAHCCCGPPVAKQAPGFLDLSVTWQAQWTWSSSLAFLVDGLQISRECYNLCWEWQFGDFSSLFNVF